MVSPIGFGAFKIGRNLGIKYAQGYDLPDEHEVDRLLNGVLDLGINYIDTAPAYGLSEERIGRYLSHRRREFVLSTKVGETFESGSSSFDFSAKAVRDSVGRSRKRLKCDALELVFIHSNGDDDRVLHHSDVVPTLIEMKERGDVQFIGFSSKSIEGALAAMTQAGGWADAIMVEYHLNDTSQEAVIAEAGKRDVGVVVKKGLASGKLSPQQAIPFLLNNPHVGSVVIGGLNLDHMRENYRIALLT